MQTLDPIENTPSSDALASPAVARNTTPILAILKAHLPARARVLEIASGSGEHAMAFARALPATHWTPSDPSPQARASIAAWAAQAALPNLAEPLDLDALRPDDWPSLDVEAIVCINMIHISPWPATLGLMAGAGRLLPRPGGLLVLYGPFLEADVVTAASNLAFDQSLKARDPAWGLRDRDAVVACAREYGLHLTRRAHMPAENLMLLFRRV